MRAFLIIEKNGKEDVMEVLAKSKYEALKGIQTEGTKIYFKGNNPYLSTVYSGLGSRQFVARLK